MANEPASNIGLFEQHFETAALNAGGPSWLTGLRQEALDKVRELGLPSTRKEEWKFTNLPRSLRELDLHHRGKTTPQVNLDQVPSLLPEDKARYRLAFLNGCLSETHSRLDDLPEGVTFAPLSHVMAERPEWLETELGHELRHPEQIQSALNTALFEEGMVLHLRAGVQLEQPVELLFLDGLEDQAIAHHPRILVILEQDSQARLVEYHGGPGTNAGLLNALWDVRLGQNAELTQVRVLENGPEMRHLTTVHAELDSKARYRSFSLTTGAALSRHELHVHLNGEEAEVTLNGAYLLRGNQHGDTTSVIHHHVPHTTSRETYKGALDDKARGVFQGQIIVDRDAQKSDGKMLNKTLLLSEKAEIDSKPELEIYADDVQCAHGATSGELDSDALFYMRSRGISEKRARSLLVESFVAEAIDELDDDSLKPALQERLRNWLEQVEVPQA
ncbi:Fe-S cluster assembly protein SufD [Fodinicurvata fenggangensis]|uniref:Fe-S cluster assembly protein SufD n=1 Tax=Fodinicurvata fenggangensis TaxID=1121830 RepID=UPI00069235D4|nr:Fe-S cluster assembly protein SufD [Fodinicurvata fenggangensis]